MVAPAKPTEDVPESPCRGAYRPWAELLKRTVGFDVLSCPCCSGRIKLLALVTDPTSVARYLRGIGETTDVPKRTPARRPPYDPWKSPTGDWASRVLRLSALARGGASRSGRPTPLRPAPRPLREWHAHAHVEQRLEHDAVRVQGERPVRSVALFVEAGERAPSFGSAIQRMAL